MPLQKQYEYQTAVMLTADQRDYLIRRSAGGSQGQVIRDALDLQAAVDSGALVTLTPGELLELQQGAAASSLEGDPAQLEQARQMAALLQGGYAGAGA